MAAKIPFEIQEEIIKRVAPVKSLLRFRPVARQWKFLIDSSQFITHHTLNHTQPHQLLVNYMDEDGKDRHVSIADDCTFPHNKVPLTLPQTVDQLSNWPSRVGCSHGLVGFLRGFTPNRSVNEKELFVLWNPSISKSICIQVASGFKALGFGVCRETGELKIVKCPAKGEAEVFTLSTRTSKTVSMNLSVPTKYRFFPKGVVIDGVIYWTDHDIIYGDDHIPTYINRIVSFDFTSEKFEEVYMPDNFKYGHVSIFKLNESLAGINYDEKSLERIVWMMVKHDDSKCSFTKLYVLAHGLRLSDYYDIIGFRKSGQLITQQNSWRGQFEKLKGYEPSTQRMDDIGFDTSFKSFNMTPYIESLLLLSYSDATILFW